MTTATEIVNGLVHHEYLAKPSTSTSAPASFLQRPNGNGPLTDAQTNTDTNTNTNTNGESLPNLGDMNARCGGCKELIDQEGGGVVVAFGSVRPCPSLSTLCVAEDSFR